MADEDKNFYGTATSLALNPLGIIALFIVLVYAMASSVTLFGGNLTTSERTPLVWFLIAFPVVVLGVFTVLVTKYARYLYAPSDYKDEANYVRMMMEAASSLALASAKNEIGASAEPVTVNAVVEAVRSAGSAVREGPGQRRPIRALWVDDNPNNQVHERNTLQALGFAFDLATSTAEAMKKILANQYDVVLSDLGRKEGPAEGYALLEELRKMDRNIPFFLYTRSASAAERREAHDKGAQGRTNDPRELVKMVTSAVSHLRT